MRQILVLTALWGVGDALVAVPHSVRHRKPLRAADAEEEKPMTLYETKEPFTNRYSSVLTSNKKQGASQAMSLSSAEDRGGGAAPGRGRGRFRGLPSPSSSGRGSLGCLGFGLRSLNDASAAAVGLELTSSMTHRNASQNASSG